jgi:hypothetical protein
LIATATGRPNRVDPLYDKAAITAARACGKARQTGNFAALRERPEAAESKARSETAGAVG